MPGVYFEEAAPRHEDVFRTGHPAFLGRAHAAGADTLFQPHWLTRWEQFTERIGPRGDGFVADAVRGFFENGGSRCVVVTFPVNSAQQGADGWDAGVAKCLERLERIDGVDLVCAPDLPDDFDRRVELQQLILEHCRNMGDRFAILEPPRDTPPEQAVRNWHKLTAVTDGALYYPWLRVAAPAANAVVPPCGHVAGVYARTDDRVGVHKAPANETVNGVVDLHGHVSDRAHGEMNSVGVNCLRAFPGRGIRIWGARTLSGRAEWRYVNVRRLFLTLKRWIEETSRDVVFEPGGPQLWERVRDHLTGYCYGLFQAGALKGMTPAEAYFVKCDDETNLRTSPDSGMVVAEVGLAPVKPAEFVVVRLTQSVAGATME
jgi:phage tail sheath protein FI